MYLQDVYPLHRKRNTWHSLIWSMQIKCQKRRRDFSGHFHSFWHAREGSFPEQPISQLFTMLCFYWIHWSVTLKDSCPGQHWSPRGRQLPSCFYSAAFTKAFLDQAVVSQSNALLVDLAITSLVDQLMHRLQVGVTETVTFRKNNF